VADIFAVLSCYTALIGTCLPTFRDKLSVPFSTVKQVSSLAYSCQEVGRPVSILVLGRHKNAGQNAVSWNHSTASQPQSCLVVSWRVIWIWKEIFVKELTSAFLLNPNTRALHCELIISNSHWSHPIIKSSDLGRTFEPIRAAVHMMLQSGQKLQKILSPETVYSP